MEMVGKGPMTVLQNQSDAVVVRKALEQGDANYKAMMEIFVGRKSSQILLMKQDYKARFRRQMEQDIISIEPPHPYQKVIKLLRRLLKCGVLGELMF